MNFVALEIAIAWISMNINLCSCENVYVNIYTSKGAFIINEKVILFSRRHQHFTVWKRPVEIVKCKVKKRTIKTGREKKRDEKRGKHHKRNEVIRRAQFVQDHQLWYQVISQTEQESYKISFRNVVAEKVLLISGPDKQLLKCHKRINDPIFKL